jgi:dUTP pyrophosphatase
MGSVISYYLKPQSLQLLEDYLSSDDKSSNTCDDDYEDTGDHYKLYIYVHNATNATNAANAANATNVNLDLKNMYEESSKKHNANVDSYLKNSSANVLTESEVEENKFVDCYDSGFDLFCPENIEWQNISNFMLDHNISCAMTYKGKFVGYYLYMRSSTPVKTPLRLANNVGIIDSGYRGNIKAYFDINGSNFNFVKGHRYMQICPPNIGKPMKVVIVDSLSILGENNARAKGGYGSTGN